MTRSAGAVARSTRGRCLPRGTAARTTATFYLVPGSAAVLSWALLGETLSPLAVLGLLVASAGCWLVGATPARRNGRKSIE